MRYDGTFYAVEHYHKNQWVPFYFQTAESRDGEMFPWSTRGKADDHMQALQEQYPETRFRVVPYVRQGQQPAEGSVTA